MTTQAPNDPILKRFRAEIDGMYGNQLERVVLFGSRARGDAQVDSDYDVAVFLKLLPDRWAELDRLAKLRVDLLDETGAFFDVKPYLASSYWERSPLMHEIREEGRDL
jgi:predicted nucleotidyltransferase